MLENTHMKIAFRTFYSLAVFLFLAGQLLGQNSTIRGTVIDENGEPLVGASVIIPRLGVGANTNSQGIFSIPKLPSGDHILRASYIGYDTVYKQVTVSGREGTETVALTLSESSTILGDVVIEDNAIGKIRKTEIDVGVTAITPRQINLMPSLGTPDLAQYMQVLPGVVTTGDQGGQIYIRGGTPVQNMVLLDGAIIYSPFHSVGLFSVFDTDYLRSVDVYSAAFPAQYGGRVSAIVDIKTRNGDFEKLHGKVNVNPITAGILLEGPMKKATEEKPGRSSFLISARRSYLDVTSKSIYPWAADSIGLPFNFTDIYAKTTFTDGVNKVNLFGFFMDDNVNYQFPTTYNWKTAGGGASFLLLPSASNVILSGNFAYSGFNSGLTNVTENFPRRSYIGGFNGGLNFTYLINSVNEFQYGVSFLGFKTDYEFTNSFGLITSQVFNNTEAVGNFRWKKVIRKIDNTRVDSIRDFAILEPGVHIHYYNDHSYVSFEPRFRSKFNFNRFSLTLGTGIYSQNLMAATSDRDVVNLFQGYLAAPQNVPSAFKSHALQTATHYLAGVEMELLKNLNSRVEGWYKDFTQLTNINRDKIFPDEEDFIAEKGSAYGVDLVLRYEIPKWYVYLNYGWAKVYRDNGTQVYPTVWDRRHNLNFLASYSTGEMYGKDDEIKGKPQFSESKWEFSVRWNLGSGFPFTLTQGFFEKIEFNQDGAQTDYTTQNGNLGILYDETINGGRLPYFHRLDLSGKRRWAFNNKFMLEANVSLINAYNRANVFYFDRVKFQVVNQLPILPSAGLTLKF